jgi:hypothetical protein
MKNNAKVSYLHLHLTQHVPGLGMELKRTVDPIHYPDIKMNLSPAGVLCRTKGLTFILPYVNIQAIVIDKEDADDSKESK